MCKSCKKSIFFFKENNGLKIKVDLKLSTIKPIHAKLMNEIYQHFKQAGRQTILNGWESAGVVGAVDDARSCLLYTSPSPRDKRQSRMPSSA